MSGALQAVSQNLRSFIAPVPVPTIGAALGGGFFAGQISTAGNGIADYNLVVAPLSSGEQSRAWKTVSTFTAGTSSAIDGPTNSANMNNATHPAAQFCEAASIGGFTDWYMPAKNELEVCYYNLKPTTAANQTSWAINPNAVPSRGSNYTAETPAQTSAANFNDTGAERFGTYFMLYWSSTQHSATNGYAQYFSYYPGRQSYVLKDATRSVRAVRRLAI